MSDETAAPSLDGLWDELADVARDIARALVQPVPDDTELLALDLRAEALRRRIAAAQPPRRLHEPVDLGARRWWGAPLVSGG